MTEVRTTAVEPTDTEPWRVRVSINGDTALLVDLPYPGADPIDRHAEAALRVSGLQSIHRVTETPRGYVWGSGFGDEPETTYERNDDKETNK